MLGTAYTHTHRPPARTLTYACALGRYPVCNEAFQDLQALYHQALWKPPARLRDIAPDFKKLVAIRKQLFYMKDFLLSCAHSGRKLISDIDSKRKHLIEETDKYSLADLVETAQGTLLPYIRNLVRSFLEHIKDCTVCARSYSMLAGSRSTCLYAVKLTVAGFDRHVALSSKRLVLRDMPTPTTQSQADLSVPARSGATVCQVQRHLSSQVLQHSKVSQMPSSQCHTSIDSRTTARCSINTQQRCW
jgi:hypothetical protein